MGGAALGPWGSSSWGLGSFHPVMRHVPNRTLGFAQGVFAGQADVAQDGIIQICKGFALFCDLAGGPETGQEGGRATRATQAGQGQSLHRVFLFVLTFRELGMEMNHFW